jgi:hypothetical protein
MPPERASIRKKIQQRVQLRTAWKICHVIRLCGIRRRMSRSEAMQT